MSVQTILTGDCLEIVPTLNLPKNVAVITDPPYGVNNNGNYTRFTNGLSPHHNFHRKIASDDKPFDPSPWLTYPKVVLWGYNNFAERLPRGTTLVWVKRRENQLGQFLSDAELAWQKGGKGVYVFQHVWSGFDRASERGKTLHPTQKPVALFEWVISRLKLPADTLILDPYCGSGPVAVAAKNLGFDYIGIDIEPSYTEIAKSRLQ